jgi:hypothetical protein
MPDVTAPPAQSVNPYPNGRVVVTRDGNNEIIKKYYPNGTTSTTVVPQQIGPLNGASDTPSSTSPSPRP